ncbi:uncharacterized protein ColSpa_01606 [Colletotrichum spaethianum]|uniref:Uncharacterized protein n=1 Tax=Colletotrichum spaethianum TaxID=700344 RepID=A0AA37L8L4_9PEZI|nr:uncharacterized protein ColSpa_01606 [Colletotrichum spaethianum]GKT41425.1 hypothetical protein ColSpa_01606 [Colletotrichum spaethianum]
MAGATAVGSQQLSSSTTSLRPGLGSSPPQVSSHTDKYRRASVVKVPSPLKQATSSSPPAVRSVLQSVQLPPLGPLAKPPSSQSTISVNETPSRPKSSLSVPGGQFGSVFDDDDDPFTTSWPDRQTSQKGASSKQCSASGAEKVAHQVANARSVTRHGYRGPVEVGNFVCLINLHTGQPSPIAVSQTDGKGGTITRDIRSGKDLREIMPSDNGNAVWGRNGEFKGFEDSIAAAWVYGPG